MGRRIRLLDRDIARSALRYYLVVISLSVTLLLLENIPRVVRAAMRLAKPVGASFRVILCLVPEYLAMAGIFGIYLTAAMLAYRLVRRSELAAWWANGASTFRITAALGALAAINAGLVLLLLGWLQPLGETSIVRIDQDIASGRYGVALEAGVASRLGSDGTILFDHVDDATGRLIGVFARDPSRTISAREAFLTYAPGNTLRVDFKDGVAIDEKRTDQARAMYFRNMTLLVRGSDYVLSPEPAEPFQKLVSLPALLAIAQEPSGPRNVQVIARAEALYRIAIPVMSLLLAWLGFVLGLPDRTNSSLVAVGLGVGVIVLVLRVANLYRMQLPQHALAGDIGLLSALASLCLIIPHLHNRFGQGFIDHALLRLAGRIIRKVAPGRQ